MKLGKHTVNAPGKDILSVSIKYQRNQMLNPAVNTVFLEQVSEFTLQPRLHSPGFEAVSCIKINSVHVLEKNK